MRSIAVYCIASSTVKTPGFSYIRISKIQDKVYKDRPISYTLQPTSYKDHLHRMQIVQCNIKHVHVSVYDFSFPFIFHSMHVFLGFCTLRISRQYRYDTRHCILLMHSPNVCIFYIFKPQIRSQRILNLKKSPYLSVFVSILSSSYLHIL